MVSTYSVGYRIRAIYSMLAMTAVVVLCSAQPVAAQLTLFATGFEDTSVRFANYQEQVDPCYTVTAGAVDNVGDYPFTGAKSMRVWANKLLTDSCNHVIAGYRVAGYPLHGAVCYTLHAFVPPTPDTAQTGPEFSIQSTRIMGGDSLTFTAGIQYVPNPWVSVKWNIWQGHTWVSLASVFNAELVKNCWYRFSMYANYTDTAYDSLRIVSANRALHDLDTLIDLSAYHINGDNKHFAPSAYLTAEATNLWTPCSAPRATQSVVYYDDLILQQTDTTLHLPVQDNKPTIALYPVPARKWLQFSAPPGNYDLTISAIGNPATLRNWAASGNDIVDIAELPAGIYLLKCRSNSGVEVRRFVKE